MGPRFKLVCVNMGSGWPSGHVAVDRYINYPDRAGGNEICLNHDTDKASELEHEIDALIAELQALKLEVPKRFQQWNDLYERKSKRRE
jgi:hypothetical protein